MATRRNATIHDLRHAIDCLPTHTKRAMLDGIRSEHIIVGAYSRDGGICPMLAAHRRGGRTSLISFAKAWDAFAFRETGKARPRRATRRELLVLSSHLEASLLEEEGPSPELATAITEHKKLMAERPAAAACEDRKDREHHTRATSARPGDPDRSKELRTRPGWSWLRIFRRYDDYQRALDLLDSLPQTMADEAELEQVR
ncbi:MAG TPA: hypothetical protein VGI87_06680 [Solirubrobacteraceae bacterium]|jgi:hypothetical protein